MNIIRKTIRRLLKEAMINPSDLPEKYGIWTDLYRSAFSGEKYNFVLYDIERAKKNIDSTVESRPKGANLYYDDIVDAISGKRKPYAPIYAVMRIEVPDSGYGECNGAWEVIRAAAVEEHGPTLYDLVMSISPEGLTSDRKSVSSAARWVWDFYANNRPDIQKKFLDPASITSSTKDDCDAYEENGISLQVAQRAMNIDYFEGEWPYEWNMFLELAEEDLVSYVMSSDSVDFFYNVSDWITDNSEKIESPSWNEKEAEELWEKFTGSREGNLTYYLDKREQIRDPDYLDFSYNTAYAQDDFYRLKQNHKSFLEYIYKNLSGGIGREASREFERLSSNEVSPVVRSFFLDHQGG